MSRPGVWDVVIVGGGAIGSSVAYHLERADPGLKILVVERDPTYQRASSSLSAGNARIQFSLLENIQISLYALEVFARFGEEMTASGHSPDIRFRAEGNLFLHDARACTAARKAMDLQRSLGGEVEWLSGEEIAARFDFFDAERLTAATFGPRDGHLDGYALLMGYRAKAESMGVDFVANEATEVVTRDGRVAGIRLAGGERVSSPVVVNCAGAWAAALSRTAGIELPVVPVKRQVFVVETPESFDRPLPLTVLPSGLYFRSEAPGLLLVGRSLKEDPQGFSFSWQESRFTDSLWPELVRWVPRFDRLRLVRGWAGLYAVNPLDGNAILGEWPQVEGLFHANGFSGHGLQQAPAVGRYLSELVRGTEPTLDLSRLGAARILEGAPLTEGGLV